MNPSAPPGAGAAFAAGIISFLSPCVLPLVPGYLSLISGLSLDELSKGSDRKAVALKAGMGSVCFVLGFALVFTLLGATASAAGSLLSRHMGLLSKIAGILIIVFGLHTAGAITIPVLYYEKRFQASGIAPGYFGAFLMGLAFAFGWTPCIGPILAGILALAATQETVTQGMVLLMVYSLGLGIPFILTGFGINAFLQFFQSYKRFIRWGEILAGVLLVLVGILVFTSQMTRIIQYLPRWMYQFSI